MSTQRISAGADLPRGRRRGCGPAHCRYLQPVQPILRLGIGRQLVAQFEEECRQQEVTVIRVAATLYAIPFYAALGYRKTTGVRNGWSFEGRGLRYQPMKKVLHPVNDVTRSTRKR